MNKKLKDNNYLVIPNFIHYLRAKNLEAEYKKYCAENSVGNDPQAPLSHSNYNYISFLELLCEKTQEVSTILQETVLPTYAYSRIYKKGSVLEKHTDRDACEISLTLHLGGDKRWPIFIETPSGEQKSVILEPGDAMLYLGKIASHWRDEYGGNEYAQVFLHYVRSRGDCSYAHFDKVKDEENPHKHQEQLTKKEEPTVVNNNEVVEKKEKVSSPTLIVPKPKTTLEDFIHVFDDILPKSLCDEILNEYVNSNEWQPTLVGTGVLNTDARNCMGILLSSEEIKHKNYNYRQYLDNSIHNHIKKAVDKYTELHNTFQVDIDTGYQLLKYDEGQFYTQHTDSYRQEQRSVSCSIQLNENYEGGEFAFFDREILIRSATGSAIMFPSNFMYPHEVMEIKKGTRYSIVTWFV
jgi:hypothetical protein